MQSLGKFEARLLVIFALFLSFPFIQLSLHSSTLPTNYASVLDKCRSLKLPAGPSPTFHERTISDRFVAGTSPTLIRNATIWTGESNGTEVVSGDILLDNGMIMDLGKINPSLLQAYGSGIEVINARGKWVTPGIVDLHSHAGDSSSPDLNGADDGNSFKGIAQPWLRSIDGINTQDDSYKLSIAGGLTTALVLPGSANAIG